MKNNTRNAIIITVGIISVIGIWKFSQGKKTHHETSEEIHATRGKIEILITTTGTVQPQNRLEVKPPIQGRIEEILVREGDQIKKGQILAWMSSTERAALLDAARTKDEATIKYWEDAYKATPLISPIDANVIVRGVEPGQTVTSSDPVLVLSDRLIVKAQVDETDIGGVKLGQKAKVSLDAYPEENVEATVDHISYESKLVNNVTIYEVDILPQSVPDVFRSGMSANVEISQETRDDVLRLPTEAVQQGKSGTYVLVKENGKPERRKIKTGITDGNYFEILEGLEEEDAVVIPKVLSLPKKSASASSPFMPSGGGRNRNR